MGWEAEADGPDGPEQAYIISKADTARAIIECLIGEVIISITGIWFNHHDLNGAVS